MKRTAAVALSAVVVLAVGTTAGAALAAPAKATVRVQLMDMMVMPSTSRVPAGTVTFVVKNTGKLKHNFVVLKTSLAPSKLMMMDSRAMESGLVGKTPVFGPGQTRRLTLTQKPGKYVLLCNVAGHYMAGMRVAFRVG